VVTDAATDADADASTDANVDALMLMLLLNFFRVIRVGLHGVAWHASWRIMA
jgi:hypothetical protein